MDRKFKLLYAVVSFAVLALAFAGLPWAWTVEISDITRPIGALALVIRGFSAVIALCLSVVALQWASRTQT